MPRSLLIHFIISRTRWIIWLCAIFSLSAPIQRFIPLNGWEEVQWALELASHWQWVYLVAGITCLAVLVIATHAWWPRLYAVLCGT